MNCVKCGKPFTAENPCCCDYALNEDGTHEDGVCRSCCGPHEGAIYDGKSVAGGTFTRCE